MIKKGHNGIVVSKTECIKLVEASVDLAGWRGGDMGTDGHPVPLVLHRTQPLCPNLEAISVETEHTPFCGLHSYISQQSKFGARVGE